MLPEALQQQEGLLQEVSRQAAWPELLQGPVALRPAQVQDAPPVPLAWQVSPRARPGEQQVQQTERAAHRPAAWHPAHVHGARRRRARDVRDGQQREVSAQRVLWELHVAQAQPEEPRAARAQVLVQPAARHAGPVRQPEAQVVLDVVAARPRAPVAAVRRLEAPAAQGVARAEQRQAGPPAEAQHVAVQEWGVERPAARLQVVRLSAEPWALPWVLSWARLQAQAGRPVPG